MPVMFPEFSIKDKSPDMQVDDMPGTACTLMSLIEYLCHKRMYTDFDPFSSGQHNACRVLQVTSVFMIWHLTFLSWLFHQEFADVSKCYNLSIDHVFNHSDDMIGRHLVRIVLLLGKGSRRHFCQCWHPSNLPR